MSKTNNPVNELVHHQAIINGINMHYVEQGQGVPVILCHGFPHTWYSWHKQIPALAQAGYRVIAPDMRGMGGTEGPAQPEAYGLPEINGDLMGLLDHIGESQAIFAGLDFGAFAIYDLALMHPERVVAVIGLENPSAPHNPAVPPLAEYQEMGKNHFLHIEYFREPDAADKDLHANTREFLTQVFYALSGDYDFGQVMAHPPGISYREALPNPPPLPWKWLKASDMDVYSQAYEQSGFTGGLNWYRSMDIKWQQRKALEGMQSAVPAYFIGSENDVDLEHFHGDHPIEQMRAQFPDLKRIHMIPEAGHMLQLECPEKTTDIMLEYLAQITAIK